jgi:hypothetical protein
MLRRRASVPGRFSPWWWPSSLATCALALTTCGSSSGGGGGGANAMLEKTTGMVSAAMGGKVAFADGTGLEIPPGALASDTLITLQRAPAAVLSGSGTAGAVELVPDGLVLGKPAVLKLHYDASKVVSEADLAVMVMSRANPLARKSGEVNPFQVIEAATIDAGSDMATIPIEHFSWYSVFSFPKANLALEIPGKYLHNGDILYALTDGAEFEDGSATPMHVGLYAESPSNDRVIESTIPEHDCTPEYIEGVDAHGYDGMKGFRNLCGAHIFLGARQPLARLTTESRAKAVAAAESRRFKPYGIIGLNDSTAVGIVPGGISCVELAEDSWEEAGVNISLTPDALLWPHDQFWNTKPVTDIEGKVGEKMVIPLVGVFRHSKTRYTRLSTKSGGTLTATAFPDVFAAGRAQLVDASSSPQGFKDLVFTPSKEDVENNVTFMFTMTAPDGSTANAALTVDTFPGDDGKQCEVDAFIKMINGYWGTWMGKVNGQPFSFDGAQLKMNFAIGNDMPGGFDFEATDTAGPRTSEPGWIQIYGSDTLPAGSFRPGNMVTVPVPLMMVPGTPAGDTTFWYNCNTTASIRNIMSGTVTFKIHDDCQGADMTVQAVGVPPKGYVGEGIPCELIANFSGVAK